MPQPTSRPTNLFFPYYFGREARVLGPALLWFDHLDFVSAPFISHKPFRVFDELIVVARAVDHPLTDLLEYCKREVGASGHSNQAFATELSSLTDHYTRIAFVGPGTTSKYETLQCSELAMDLAVTLNNEPEYWRISCLQFMWRCYEYSLEMDGDGRLVLDRLLTEEDMQCEHSQLLAQCLLNHFSTFSHTLGGVIVADPRAVDLLASLGGENPDAVAADLVPAKFERGQLAAHIFQSVLGGACPDLDGQSADRYARTLAAETDALESARRKCRIAADALIVYPRGSSEARDCFDEAVMQMRTEVEAISRLDAANLRSYFERLSSDAVIWAGVAGFLAGATGALPAATLAAAAITVACQAGSTGVRTALERRRILGQSDWRFVYALQ